MDFNIFEGMQCHKVPVNVISGGHLVLEEAGGELRVSQGAENFVPTPAHSPYVIARVAAREKVSQVP